MAGEKSAPDKPFRYLGAEELARLSTDERADYLRRATEALKRERKPAAERKQSERRKKDEG